MDFVIPNLAAIESAPDQVINIECQTTLKDRFRLTTGKSTRANVKRYLATTTGFANCTGWVAMNRTPTAQVDNFFLKNCFLLFKS